MATKACKCGDPADPKLIHDGVPRCPGCYAELAHGQIAESGSTVTRFSPGKTTDDDVVQREFFHKTGAP